jgi:flagellar hook-length control protein FliK
MPLAPNALLQTNATAATKTASAIQSNKTVEASKDNASSFSDVYSKQAKVKSTDERDTPSKTVRDKAPAEKSKAVADKDKPASDDKTASTQSTVADSGNTLPVTPVASSDQQSGDSDNAPVDPSLLTAAAPDPTLPVVDPSQDPTLLALAAQAAAQPVTEPVVEVAPKPATDAATAAAVTVSQAATAAPVVAQVTPPTGEKPFDPYADPLEGLSAVQLALENANAKTQSATQNAQLANTAAKTGKSPTDTGNVDPSQNVANNLTALADQLPVQKSSTESSDKSFGSVIDDGLKDGQAAATDTRVDNFADRLAAMSQAAQQAKVPAAASAAPLINQPLAMHQSGWSEGVVDRVMYLSSQNLKSAQIQLEPAELGRLDIRVNMAQDQQTQVTFMSAHVGVREALESQMGKLRDSFNQQGLGQVDVSVADQSRQQSQQQQQAQEEQAANAQRAGSGGRTGSGSGDGSTDDASIADAAIPLSQPATRVIGTSEVDYYA